MSSNYHAVENDEKFTEVGFPRRTSTSTSDSTLLEDEEDHTIEPRSRWTSKWMWLVHVTLLSLSFTMFVSALFTKASTLEHVKKFSAYCKLLSLGQCPISDRQSAPAAEAVEYKKVKFNATMGEGSPYVGKGAEVDKAWHAISYDSK